MNLRDGNEHCASCGGEIPADQSELVVVSVGPGTVEARRYCQRCGGAAYASAASEAQRDGTAQVILPLRPASGTENN